MKSKISCWRLVRSMSARSRSDWVRSQRTCVRTVAPPTDGRNPWRAGAGRGYTRPRCACGGIGRRARLRALWRGFSVEVRVLSGASQITCKRYVPAPDDRHEHQVEDDGVEPGTDRDLR